MQTSTFIPEEAGAGTIHFEPVPVETVDPTDLDYHQLCRADEFQDLEGKPFHVNGTHLAVSNTKINFTLLITDAHTWGILCPKAVSEMVS